MFKFMFDLFKIMRYLDINRYKVIFTLDVECFLSDTVADSADEGACVDL